MLLSSASVCKAHHHGHIRSSFSRLMEKQPFSQFLLEGGTGGTRSTTQTASPLGFSWSHSRHFNTENRKAFVVGLFKPRTSWGGKEKLPLVSWFRLRRVLCTVHAISLTCQWIYNQGFSSVCQLQDILQSYISKIPLVANKKILREGTQHLVFPHVTAGGLGSEVVAIILT